MDDGFQNPAIAKDASLIVIDGDRGLGNACVFPAGPLRAPLPPQLDRTDALIVDRRRSRGRGGCRRHRRAGQAGAVGASAGRRGVGRVAARQARARFCRDRRSRAVFPDAARERDRGRRGTGLRRSSSVFAKAEIESLLAEARRDALTLVTTEKDLARLRGREGLPAWAREIVPFAVTLEFDDAAQVAEVRVATGCSGHARRISDD